MFALVVVAMAVMAAVVKWGSRCGAAALAMLLDLHRYSRKIQSNMDNAISTTTAFPYTTCIFRNNGFMLGDASLTAAASCQGHKKRDTALSGSKVSGQNATKAKHQGIRTQRNHPVTSTKYQTL